jgi:hypothetical protein
MPHTPISADIIDCYYQKGRERIAEITQRIREANPNYEAPIIPARVDPRKNVAENTQPPASSAPPPPLPASTLKFVIPAPVPAMPSPQEKQAANTENTQAPAAPAPPPPLPTPSSKPVIPAAVPAMPTPQEKQAANNAQEFAATQADAKAQQEFEDKLRQLGYRLIGPEDFELDWRELSKSGEKIAVRGLYVKRGDADVLGFISDKAKEEMDAIDLDTDDATRPARKAMLDCREAGFRVSLCDIAVGGTVQTRIYHKGELDQSERPELVVSDGWVIPLPMQKSIPLGMQKKEGL